MPETPDWKNAIAERLAPLDLPPAREAEIIDELSAHLNEDYRRLVAGGASPEEAAAIALESLEDSPPLAEAIRRVEPRASREPVSMGTPRSSRLADFARDLRYALRSLARTPGFTALAVLSLALGIGGNAAMFGILSSALIQPLPYPDPGRLVEAVNSGYYPPGGLAALQQQSRTMDFAGYTSALELNLTGRGEPIRVRGSAVSANLFQVLGVEVELGRALGPGDDSAGRDNLVVLSHALWQDRFAGDPAVIGRVISLGGVDRQVVGVAPRSFAFPNSASAFWIPLHLDSRDPTAYWARGFMPVVARLRPGVTLSQAQHEIAFLSVQMLSLFPYPMGRDWASAMTVTPLRDFLTSDIRVRLLVLQAAVGLVLLIACANVAGLLLARAIARQKEIALRVAVGASRGRIVRQLLTESLTLSSAGGLFGVLLALGGASALETALPAGAAGLRANWEVLALVCGLSLATGLIFGMVPALAASRQDLALLIKTGGPRASGAARARLRSGLIVAEVALAVILTVSAGLLMRSLWNLAQVHPGFEARNVLTLRISPNQSLCRERAACIALYDELVRRARDLPGVQDAAAANAVPLAANIPASSVKVEGLPFAPAERAAPMFWAGSVTPDYFRAMGISILQGRALSPADGDKSSPVIVVSASTARRYWPGQNPIGKHVQLVWEDRWRTVVGVAADVRQFDLAGRTPDFLRGAMYMPYAQTVDTDRQLPAIMNLVVLANGDPARVAAGVRSLLRTLNSDVPVGEIQTMVSRVNESTRQSRSMTWLFAGFAFVALALASVGVYGVVSYSMAQRTFEIGVRMALGAGRRRIIGLALAHSFRLVFPGLVVGLAASLALTHLLETFLYGAAPTDPLTIAAVCALLLAVALLAGLVPARRAAGIDPLRALRAD